MSPTPTLSPQQLDHILREHRELVALANEVEYHLYRMGEHPGDSPVSDCQQAAGALLAALRKILFHHDQVVLPLLESLTQSPPG